MKRALLIAAMLHSGCVSINTFESPRTIPPGDLNVTLGLSSFLRNTEDDQYPVPGPVVGLRVGLAESFDAGAIAAASGHFRGDIKYSLLEEGSFDLSLGLAMSLILYPTQSGADEGSLLLAWDLPILFGINVSDNVSLIPMFAPGYAFEPSSGGKSVFFRTGFGVRIQLSDFVSLMPQLSSSWDPDRLAPVDAALGFAVMLGSQP